MPDFDIEVTITETTRVEFEVYCATCGEGLCGQSEGVNTYRRGTPAVRVEVCRECVARAVEKAESDADEKGYDRGYQDGLRDSQAGESAA